jgi:LPP20 lipoprotein
MKGLSQGKRGILATVGAMVIVSMVVGCASQKPTGQEAGGMSRVDTPLQDVKGLPDWVLKGGAGEKIEGRRVLQGVGSVSGVVNPTLRRKSAGAQARNDLAATLQVYVAGLNKQYMAETTAGDFSQHDVEQRIQDTMKQVTEATLVGAQIVEYWEHPLRNEAYALARLDMEQFKDIMKNYAAASSQFKQLDANLREWVQKNADKAHDELNQELEKRKQN